MKSWKCYLAKAGSVLNSQKIQGQLLSGVVSAMVTLQKNVDI